MGPFSSWLLMALKRTYKGSPTCSWGEGGRRGRVWGMVEVEGGEEGEAGCINALGTDRVPGM